MQEGVHQEDAAPMDLTQKNPAFPNRRGIDQAKEWRRRCLCDRILKVISVGKEGGRERVLVP